MDDIIYYFTGTGNSLKISKDLAAALNTTEIVSISKVIHEEINYPLNKIGIIFPVYFGALPPIVAEFIRKLDTSQINYIYTIATCNDFPGGSLNIVKKILKKKKKELNAGFSITMPGNYIPLYPPLIMEEQQERFENAARKVIEISKIINEGKNKKISSLGRVMAFLQKRNDRKLPLKDKKFRVDNKCNGCGLCQKICPVENIEMIKEKPQWLHKCQQCLACLHWCPQVSIQVGNKTVGRTRYHHPEITIKDFLE